MNIGVLVRTASYLHYPPHCGGVCVATPELHEGELLHHAGECGMTVGPHSTMLPQSWDTESDQLGVPAQ